MRCFLSPIGFIGLAISYALTLTSGLGGTINIFVETERKMVALERVNEYIEREKSESNEAEIDFVLPFAWPSQGVISFANVYLKYRFDVILFFSRSNTCCSIITRTSTYVPTFLRTVKFSIRFINTSTSTYVK